VTTQSVESLWALACGDKKLQQKTTQNSCVLIIRKIIELLLGHVRVFLEVLQADQEEAYWHRLILLQKG